jgi:hypothetical protein
MKYTCIKIRIVWWGGGVKTGSTRHVGHFWPIVTAPGDLIELRLAGETEVLGENLPQRHFVPHNSHFTRTGLQPQAAAVGSQKLTA